MALINCPECNHTVSDKAVSCPSCGFPLTSIPSAPTTPKKRRNSHKAMRLPNGFGTIREYKREKLRKPYGAFPPAVYNCDGKNTSTKAIGYYGTYKEAYEALLAWHNDPTLTIRITFGEVYRQWYSDRFSGRTKISDSTQRHYKSIEKWYALIWDRQIKELRTEDYQRVLDECNLAHGSVMYLLSGMSQATRFALQHDYISKDYAQFAKLPDREKSEKGVPFTEEELALLWRHKDHKDIQIALIMIYSGYRIGELGVITIDRDEKLFKGGLKTDAGRERIVPIHPCIMPFLDSLKGFTAPAYRLRWHNRMKELGLQNAQNGSVHTPHDCRHTFSWLCDKYGVDSLSKHLIMGHSLGKDVEANTYGHRTIEQLREAIYKISTNNTIY